MEYVDKNYLGLNCYLRSAELTKEEMDKKFSDFITNNNIEFLDMREKYELDRMPMGCAHTFSSDYIEQIYEHLRNFICDGCMANEGHGDDPDISVNHDELPTLEKVYELLRTSCGAEWMFAVNEDVKIDE